MAEVTPEVKVVLTAEDQGVAAAIRALNDQLKSLKPATENVAAGSAKAAKGFISLKQAAVESLDAIKLRIANLPGLGNFGSALAVRAYEPIGKLVEQGAGDLEAKFGGAALAIGGVTAGIVALGVAAAAVDDRMMHLARSIANTAAATGLTFRQVQELNEVAKEMDVDAGSLQTSFTQLNRQLGEYVVLGSKGGSSSQLFARTLNELGVRMQEAPGKARPLNDVLSDFYDVLQKIPDQATRTEVALTALGPRAAVIAQIFEEASQEGLSYRDVLKSVDDSGNVLADSEVANLLRAEREWEELRGKVRGFFTELGGFIAESTLSWRGFERAVVQTSLALGTTLPGKTVDSLVDKLLPLKAGTAGITGGGDANFLALRQIVAANQQLADRVAVLRAGGENQEKLKEAEASYAFAVKSHNEALAKAYSTQISELKEIIALEDAKKHHAGDRGPLEGAAKAELAFQLKQQQDALQLEKAGAAERAAEEKSEYERGLVSIAQYYEDRRKAIADETQKEIAAITAERDELQTAANLAGEKSISAKADLRVAKTPADRQRLAELSDRYIAEQFNALGKLDELNTRISEAEIASRTKITQLGSEQDKAEEEGKKRILEFLRQIDQLQGKTADGARQEAEARTAEMRGMLEQFKGQIVGGVTLDSSTIDALLQKYQQLSDAEARFSEAEKATESAMRSFEIDRASIELQLHDHKISEAQAERQFLALLQQEIPLLEQKAQAELAAAKASANPQAIQSAQQELQRIRDLSTATQELGNKSREIFGSSMAQVFESFASSATRATGSVAQAFGEMEMTVIHALENTAAQMIANALTQQAIDKDTRLSAAETAAANTWKSVSAIPLIGWILAPPAAAAAFAAVLAFAKGGPVIGPGGPTDDRIPAMLSAGEFVVNASAAKSFGVDNLHAINSGALASASSPPAIARIGDFALPRLGLDEKPGSAQHINNVNTEIHLHHNGPDALEVLRGRLVPELKQAFRNGALDFIAP